MCPVFDIFCFELICCRGIGGMMLAKAMRSLGGPKYDGKYLHEVVRQKLGEIKLNETITNIVIPTFDIKTLQPIIFSSYQVNYKFILIMFFIYVQT